MEWVERPRPKDYLGAARVEWFFSPKGRKWPLYSVSLYQSNGHTNLSMNIKRGLHQYWERPHEGVPDVLFAYMMMRVESYLELPVDHHLRFNSVG